MPGEQRAVREAILIDFAAVCRSDRIADKFVELLTNVETAGIRILIKKRQKRFRVESVTLGKLVEKRFFVRDKRVIERFVLSGKRGHEAGFVGEHRSAPAVYVLIALVNRVVSDF